MFVRGEDVDGRLITVAVRMITKISPSDDGEAMVWYDEPYGDVGWMFARDDDLRAAGFTVV